MATFRSHYSYSLCVQNFYFLSQCFKNLIASFSPGADLSVFTPGRDLKVEGFANANNNGTDKIIVARLSEETDPTGSHSVVILDDFTSTVEAVGQDVTLTEVIPAPPPSTIEDVRVYTGTQTQTPDSLI